MAQNTNINYPIEKDLATSDGIITASYEVVSVEAGDLRAWERDLSLHDPNAVYSFQENVNGSLKKVTMILKDFHKETNEMVAETAFYESEVNNEVRVFGNIAHVWSTYQTPLEKNNPVVRRGINSIQLYRANERWYIVWCTFYKERGDLRIPQTFDRN
jgi:hypothetical protein